MAEVFISYSRKHFGTTEWLREIFTSIEAVDNFVFVISPESVASDYCRKEIATPRPTTNGWFRPAIGPCPKKRFPKRRPGKRSAEDDRVNMGA
jgi:hypothetical protein